MADTLIPGTIFTVPLRQLRLSPLNVRKSNLDEDIEGLADEIDAHGLKQNLVVVRAPDGKFEVVAGGRRLRALQLLIDRSFDRPAGGVDVTWSVETPVPVMLEVEDEGRATSLSENLQRVAMNPADEVEAFAAIVAEHADEDCGGIAYCARRFGVTEKHVERRLRLADLAAQVLDALRDGTIGVAAAEAYASFADHKLQAAVFAAEERRTFGTKHDAKAVRDAMRQKTYPANIAQARYVGLDAYLAAGGLIERDLFLGADEGERLTDPALLDRLATAKAREELVVRAREDGLAGALLTRGFSAYPAWPPAPTGMRQVWGEAGGLPADLAVRATRIGVYTIALDGSSLTPVGTFKPDETAPPTQHSIDWHERRREEEREQRLYSMSARLAAFTALPDLRAFASDEGEYAWDAEDDEDGSVLVTFTMRLPGELVDAQRDAAAAMLAAQQEEEEAALGATIVAPGDVAGQERSEADADADQLELANAHSSGGG